MKLGKQEGCMFDDRIDIEVSPSQLEDLINYAKRDATKEENYDLVGIARELKDLLQKRLDKWREERDKLDKKQ